MVYYLYLFLNTLILKCVIIIINRYINITIPKIRMYILYYRYILYIIKFLWGGFISPILTHSFT